jgi:hypothetical protein
MRLVRFRRTHVDVTRELARQLSEDGYSNGHFRDVESLTAVFDQDVLQDFKSNLEALLEDFPEERGRYSILNGEEAEMVRFDQPNVTSWSVLVLIRESGIRLTWSVRRHSLVRSSTLALSSHN